MTRPVLAALIALLAALILPGMTRAAPAFPALDGRVVDAADLLPPATEQALTERLAALERTTGRQLVVVTLAGLDGYDIADYGYQLGRHWRIGDAQRDDGALLIVAPQERKVRIEVGYGLEGVLPDAMAHRIVQRTILPPFRAGDMAGGIMAGADALITHLQLPPEEAAARAQAAADENADTDGVPLLFLLLFLLPFLLGWFRGGRRGRNAILWGPGIGGSGHWGGGRRGGGGFSGGGGSFGGGGASGSW